MQRLSQQKSVIPILPKPSPQISSPTKPIDLTESLMQSNISQMITPQKSTGYNMFQNKPSGLNQMSPMPTNVSNWASPPQNANPGWNQNAFNNMNMLNFNSTQQVKQPLLNQSNNWSGFDSLMNSSGSVPSQQPLLNNSNSQNLTNNDIMDLLGWTYDFFSIL